MDSDIGTEINIVSGFSMDDNDENSDGPGIIIENNQDNRTIVPLTNDIILTDDIDVILQEQEHEQPEKKEIPKYSKPSKQRQQIPIKMDERKPLPRVESYNTSGSDSDYIEYKRKDNHDKPKTMDFGDIADPVKHKQDTGADYYSDNNSGGTGGSDTESYYSRSERKNDFKSYDEPKNDHRNDYNSESRNDHRSDHRNESSYESEGDRYRREEEEKQDYLIKLQALESSKGIRLSREFSIKSRLDDIKFEYEKQKSILERTQSVEFMQNLLITFVHGVELMNNKFDPVGAKLNGWSESVMENQGSYESIFEKLHEKYQGTVDIAPELELLMALASSAFMFHMMKTVFNTAVPNLPQAMMQDPNLMRGLGSAAARAADMSNQQKAGIPTPANQSMSGPSQGFDIGSLLGTMMQGMQGMPSQSSMIPPTGNAYQHAFQNPPPRPTDPRNEPKVSGLNQTTYPVPGNFVKPRRDDDDNSRVTDLSSDSDGSGIRIRRSKSDKKIIDLGDF